MLTGELSEYSNSDIWKEIGPGGLFLATEMARLLNLNNGDLVLDLGGGKGEIPAYEVHQDTCDRNLHALERRLGRVFIRLARIGHFLALAPAPTFI